MTIRSKLAMVKGALQGLDQERASGDPVEQFRDWFETAEKAGLHLPNAFTLATATSDGAPSARVLLLKGFDRDGFVFYTNYESRKCEDLAENPRAAMVFHWTDLERQVRIQGPVEKVSREQSDAYFQSRPRGSRIGAWASSQSSMLESRRELEEQVKKYEREFKGKDVPLPPFWGGFRLRPEMVEFWQGRADRLHDRLCYRREGHGWKIVRLSP